MRNTVNTCKKTRIDDSCCSCKEKTIWQKTVNVTKIFRCASVLITLHYYSLCTQCNRESRQVLATLSFLSQRTKLSSYILNDTPWYVGIVLAKALAQHMPFSTLFRLPWCLKTIPNPSKDHGIVFICLKGQLFWGKISKQLIWTLFVIVYVQLKKLKVAPNDMSLK